MRAFGIYHVLAAASVLSTALAQDKLKISKMLSIPNIINYSRNIY